MKFIAAALLFAGCVLGMNLVSDDLFKVPTNQATLNDRKETFRLIDNQAEILQKALQKENPFVYMMVASENFEKCIQENENKEEKVDCRNVKVTQVTREQFDAKKEELKKKKEELQKKAEEERARYETFEAKVEAIEKDLYEKNQTVRDIQKLEEEADKLMGKLMEKEAHEMEKEVRDYLKQLFTGSVEKVKMMEEEEKIEEEEEKIEEEEKKYADRLDEIEKTLKTLQSDKGYKDDVNEAELKMAIAQDEYYQNKHQELEKAALFQQGLNEILARQEEGKAIDEESFKNDFYTLYENTYGAEALEKLKESEAKVQEQMKPFLEPIEKFQEQMKKIQEKMEAAGENSEQKEAAKEEAEKVVSEMMMEFFQKMFQNATPEDEEKAEENNDNE